MQIFWFKLLSHGRCSHLSLRWSWPWWRLTIRMIIIRICLQTTLCIRPYWWIINQICDLLSLFIVKWDWLDLQLSFQVSLLSYLFQPICFSKHCLLLLLIFCILWAVFRTWPHRYNMWKRALIVLSSVALHYSLFECIYLSYCWLPFSLNFSVWRGPWPTSRAWKTVFVQLILDDVHVVGLTNLNALPFFSVIVIIISFANRSKFLLIFRIVSRLKCLFLIIKLSVFLTACLLHPSLTPVTPTQNQVS